MGKKGNCTLTHPLHTGRCSWFEVKKLLSYRQSCIYRPCYPTFPTTLYTTDYRHSLFILLNLVSVDSWSDPLGAGANQVSKFEQIDQSKTSSTRLGINVRSIQGLGLISQYRVWTQIGWLLKSKFATGFFGMKRPS